MKIRNGFVSNSSSSSFICKYAEVIDEVKFRDNFDYKIYTGLEIIEYYEKIPTENRHTKKLTIRHFSSIDSGCDFYDRIDYDGIIEHIIKNPESKYVFITADEHDDYDLWDGDEYNYDIDYTDFSENIQKIYIASEKEGVRDIVSLCYAGRNG